MSRRMVLLFLGKEGQTQATAGKIATDTNAASPSSLPDLPDDILYYLGTEHLHPSELRSLAQTIRMMRYLVTNPDDNDSHKLSDKYLKSQAAYNKFNKIRSR